MTQRSGLLQRSGNPKANPTAKLAAREAGGVAVDLARLQRFAEDRLGYLCEFDWKPEATAGGQWIWVEEEPKVYKTKGKGKGKGVKGGKAKGKGKRSLGLDELTRVKCWL